MPVPSRYAGIVPAKTPVTVDDSVTAATFSSARRLILPLLMSALVLLVTFPLSADQKRRKDEEPKTQVLPLPKEPPMALGADVESLSFRVTPLLKIGKLSAQIRDSLNELIRDARGSSVIKLRAFVAGAGDSRRVQAIVSDLFTEKKLNLPVISIIQVGALGDDAAQVVIEAVIAERRPLNPAGLAFLAGQTGPTLDASLAKLTQSLSAASLTPSAVLSVTCFSDNLGDYRQHVAQANAIFSKASINLVQSQRQPGGARTTCEAVARSHEGDSSTQISVLGPARVTLIPGRSRLVFTGLQLAFGGYLDDANSALKNLRKFSEAASGNFGQIALLDVYSLSGEATSALRKTASKFDVPGSTITIQQIEGLPSLDAALGMEAIMVGTGASTVSSLR
jgi:enamine deaminase RidA (YjgF/YER057c/UK114 family)